MNMMIFQQYTYHNGLWTTKSYKPIRQINKKKPNEYEFESGNNIPRHFRSRNRCQKLVLSVTFAVTD